MLNSATVDFELGLHKGFKKIFSNVELIDCLFHYKQTLNRKTAKLGLKNRKYKARTQKIIRKLGNLCWKVDPYSDFQRIKKKIISCFLKHCLDT